MISIEESIKGRALQLGFSQCGISKPEPLEEEAIHLENWLKKGFHGEMKYMESNFEKRINPKALFPEVKTIVSVTAHYDAPKSENESSPELLESKSSSTFARVSTYAAREDYHQVMKEKLKELFEFICERFGAINGRAFVDSAPLMDKALALRAGLGWIGKHTNLISKKQGSFYFIGSLLLDIEIKPSATIQVDHCGSCTACLDLCPTEAIVAPFQVDARKCISYLTIELKRDFTDDESALLGEWLFGCDICQAVCPWNRFQNETRLKGFSTKNELLFLDPNQIDALTKSTFEKTFGVTPIFRTGLRRLKRNAAAVRKNKLK
ncbi:MAG: tRNA epoxyqueuosine(34) reductase QueG [Chloroherpetonaceae bacterium]|nr:tRNA epoxyqueuosine(34) reductase QueG [Chloroherpetonaceae bacterium]